MTTSVIVLNYNDWLLTQKYVSIIESYDCVEHIIIVDNCSSDGSFEQLCKLASNKIDVIQTTANKGYAAGNNEGIRYVAEKYGMEGIVAISNPDIRISEKSLSSIFCSFEENHNQFAATGEVFNSKGQRITLFTWKIPTYTMLLVQNCAILRVFLKNAFGYGKQYSNPSMIEQDGFYSGEVLPGCFFAADMHKMIHIGMFSERTFLYYEEEILFYKAKQMGYCARVIKDAALIHEEGATTKKAIRSWVKRERLMEDSCIQYLQECLQVGILGTFLHRLLFYLFMPERYLISRIKQWGESQ